MPEIKSFPFEVKVNNAKRTIEGYASTFGNKDFVGDIVQPGAFKKTLAERASKVKLLWQHDPSQPLGKPIHMAEDSKGLYVEAKISKSRLGDEALELIQDGVIEDFSIGYDVLKDEYDTQEKTRLLKELKLYEFSVVTFPANEQAAILGVKNYDEFNEMLKKTSMADVTRFLKAGRKVSNANRQLIESAIEALTSVLALAEPLEEEDDTKGTQQPGQEPPKIEQLDGIEAKELAELLQNFKIAK